jgi:hypothetical protein
VLQNEMRMRKKVVNRVGREKEKRVEVEGVVPRKNEEEDEDGGGVLELRSREFTVGQEEISRAGRVDTSIRSSCSSRVGVSTPQPQVRASTRHNVHRLANDGKCCTLMCRHRRVGSSRVRCRRGCRSWSVGTNRTRKRADGSVERRRAGFDRGRWGRDQS